MDTTKYRQALLRRLSWAVLIAVGLAVVLVQWLPLDESQRTVLRVFVVIAGFLGWAELTVVVPRYWPAPWIVYGNIIVDSLVIAGLDVYLPTVDLSPLYVLVIVISATVDSRRAALFAAVLATGLDLLAPPMQTPAAWDGFVLLINATVFIATAVLVSDLVSMTEARWRASASQSEIQRRQIERQRDELEGLFGITQVFGSLEDAPQTLRQVTEGIAHLIGAEICILTRLDDRGNVVRGTPPGYGVPDEIVDRFEYQVDSEVRTVWDISQREYFVLNDLTGLPSNLAAYAIPMCLRQVVGARMMHRGRPIGLVFAANKSGGRIFDENDARLLCILASQAAIAMENARLYASARDNLQDVTRLFAVSAELSSDSDLDTIPNKIVRAAAQALNAPMASMALLNETTGKLEYVATPDVPPDVSKQGFREGGLAMTVIRSGQARFIEDMSKASNVNPVSLSWGVRSVACLPIQHSGKRMGVLYVNYTKPHSFTDVEKNMLAIYANQAAIALENARLRRIGQRRAVEAERLAALSRSLAETMDLDEMFRVVEQQIHAAFPTVDSGALLLFDPVRRVLEPRASFGFDREILGKIAFGLDESVPGEVFRTNRARLLGDQAQIREARQMSMRPENQALLAAAVYGSVYPTSEICAPVSSGGEKLGVVLLEHRQSPDPLTADELRLAEAMADRMALAIRNAQLYARGLRRATQLAAVAEATRRVAAILNIDELLPTVTQLIYSQFGYRYVHLFLNNRDERVTVYRAGAGPAASAMEAEHVTIGFGTGIVGWVAERGVVLLANDVTQEPHFVPYHLLTDAQSELALPLQVGARLIGVLDVQSERVNAFEGSDVATLETLARQIGIAIENAELYGEMQEQARRDSLTQAYNHGYFLARLGAEVALAERDDCPLSLIMLDIDLFKEYNDRYGHVVGDQVLTDIAQAIRKHVHAEDLVGRWGGEEFGVALLRTDADAARGIALRIRETLAGTKIFAKNGELIPPPTVSQGLATFPRHARETASLIDRADAALYRAKSLGRDQILTCEQ